MQPSHRFLAVLAVAAALFLPALPIDAQEPAPPSQKIHKAHAIAMHGEPAYGPDFKHFDYVNPNAPKGGTLILSADGTFDTFNPFTAKGTAAASAGIATETLMVTGEGEAFTMYALLSETIEGPGERLWIHLTLNPKNSEGRGV